MRVGVSAKLVTVDKRPTSSVAASESIPASISGVSAAIELVAASSTAVCTTMLST